MLNRKLKTIMFALAIATTYSSLSAQIASTQQRPRSIAERRQQPGKGYWANQRTSRNLQHAHDYSRSIGRYTTQAATIDPAIAKAESEMLGRQIQGIQRDLTIVREQSKENPRVVEQVKGIEAKLVQTAETQSMLHAECCKDSPDGMACGEMCAKITASLEEIAKDHEKLMKAMGHDVPETAAQPAQGEK